MIVEKPGTFVIRFSLVVKNGSDVLGVFVICIAEDVDVLFVAVLYKFNLLRSVVLEICVDSSRARLVCLRTLFIHLEHVFDATFDHCPL